MHDNFENLSQRKNDFQEQLDNILLIKKHIEKTSVSDLRTQTKPHTRTDQDVGVRQVSEWLNNNIMFL